MFNRLTKFDHWSGCCLQKAELHAAEEEILRRIPIGGYVPERAVVEQLGRVGMDQVLVRRACVYLVQREVLEYKKDRRILHRRR
jgi:DNA replication licensing factor MCM5